MPNPFRDRLTGPPILADGGMGTLLYQRGIPFERSFDELNLSAGNTVLAVHQAYLHAGAELIETNTFGANRLRLAGFGHEARVRDINFHGVKLAREAREIIGKPAFVAGSIGPLGSALIPIGNVSVDEAVAVFAEQAEALLEGGVDVFIIETMAAVAEVAAAVRAIRGLCNLPIVAQMSFTETGATFLGETPQDAVTALNALPVEVIGVNCAVGPQQTLDILRAFAERSARPLSVMPNAGLPRMIGGRFMYPSAPTYFASFVPEFVRLGARIIGGCCGTTPDHVRAMAAALAGSSGSPPEQPSAIPSMSGWAEICPTTDPTAAEHEEAIAPRESSSFAARLGRTFLVSIELDPPKGTNPKKIIEGARLFKRHGVDAVNIADSPMARVRMSAVAAAAMIKHEVGIEPILHFTCRDRNLMGLQSDLIGAHALGIRNVLAITGDPPSVGDFPGASGVYDVDAIGLVKILARLNKGEDFAGASIGAPTSFAIGVACNPTADDPDRELERLRQKIDAGAMFTFTQPLYELAALETFLDRLSGKPIPIFLGLLPLMSFRHACFLHNEVPGITIPESHLLAMERAGEHGAEVGVELSKELLAEAQHLVDGVYLMPSFGRYETCLEVVKTLLAARKVQRQPALAASQA